jgi:hypothetical protein
MKRTRSKKSRDTVPLNHERKEVSRKHDGGNGREKMKRRKEERTKRK